MNPWGGNQSESGLNVIVLGKWFVVDFYAFIVKRKPLRDKAILLSLNEGL